MQRENKSLREIELLKREIALLRGSSPYSGDSDDYTDCDKNVHHLLDALHEFLFILDETRTIQYVNQHVVQQLGYTRAELEGQNILIVYPPEYHEEAQAMIGELLREAEDTCLIPLLCKDGKQISVETKLTQGNWNGRPALFGVSRNITECQLKEQGEKYRGIFEESISAIYLFDSNKVFVDSNQAGLDLLGYTREELFGMSISDVDADVEVVLPAHQQLLAGDRIINYEHRLIRKDGRIITVLNNSRPLTNTEGDITGLLSTLIDITERKKIEEALRASEERYRAYMENSPIGIFIMDSEGRFLEANDATCRVKGYSREELLSLTAIDLFPPESRDESIEIIKEIQQNGKYCGELLTRCGDGTHRWIALDIITLKSGDFLGFDRDIHESKLAAGALKRRDAILQAVTFMAEGVLTSDSWEQHIGEVLQLLGEAAQVSRTYVFQNHIGDDGVCMTSQKYEWVSGDTQPKIKNPKLQKVVMEAFGFGRWVDVFSRNELVDGLVKDFPESERKALEPQGIKSIVAAPIFVENKWWGFIGFDENESERIWASAETEAIKTVAATLSTAIEYDLAQEAIRKNEQDLKTLVDSNPDHVTIYRSDGMILDVIAPDSWQHHISSKHVKGKYITEAHTPEFASMIQDKIDDALSTGQSQALEFDVSDNGEKCYYESRYVISGSNTVVATLRNMTQVKMLEQEVLKVQKLESLGALAGGIAHDFNNILTGVMGNISLALTEPDDFALIAEYLEESEKAIMRAKGLTQQLLTFSSGGKPIKKIASINELLKESVPFAIRGSNCKVEFDLDPELYHAEIDTGQLRQVIHNIVLNALQAMPEGGLVRVATECIVKDKVAGPHLTPGKYVRIVIGDEGMGISHENIRRIYDPYFTTKQAGSGLGLTSSYSVIQQHGGCIDVESKLGVGSSFIIDLPATDISPGKVMLSREEVAEGQGRILVMDDEKIICDLAKKILLKVGYDVDCACDGDEALRLYKQSLASDEKYDVVILDLTIPGGKGGKQTMLELRMIDPDVNAIVCSGYSNDPVMAESSKWGFKGVVTKPFKPKELIKAVQAVAMTDE